MRKQTLLKSWLLLFAIIAGVGNVWAEEIATATFDGKNETYTEGWTTTGTGKGRTDCIIIGAEENITSPAFDLSGYSKVTITFTGRRYGSLSGSKATVDASIAGMSVGTIDITRTGVGLVDGSIVFTPTANMTSAKLVFTCTNATSAGSTHGAGIGSITITGLAAGETVTYTVTYDANGATSGTVPVDETEYEANAQVTVKGNTGDLAKSNFEFDGWNTKADGSGDSYNAGGTFSITGNTTLYAKWKAVSSGVDYVTLPFSWDGGTKADLTALDGVTANGLGDNYSQGNAPYLVKFDTTGDYILIKTDSQPGKVTIGVKMLGGSDSSKITVQGSSDGETFTDVEALTISGAQNDVLTLETSSPFDANDRYVKLVFTKGSNVGVGPITIAKPSTDPQIVANGEVELAYDAASGEIAYTINNPVDGTSLSARTEAEWISNVRVATDKVTFTTTANEGAERTATVTLTYGTLTKDVTVIQAANPNAPGSENNPYTVAQAREAIDKGTVTQDVYVKGIVSKIVTPYNETYGNISYNISIDGSTTADQLQAYRGKSYNGENFTSEDDIKVGDEVVIHGDLKKYNNTTYEFAADNQLVSLVRNTVEIDASDVRVAYDATSGSINYSITNPANDGELTAALTAYSDWLALGTVGETIPFTVTNNPNGTSRSATVLLTYTYHSNLTLTKEVMITQAANPNVVMTIAAVRAQGTGDVNTKGVVTSYVGNTAYIQDATAAICIYGANLGLEVGQEIIVSGTLKTYNGLLEITDPQITVDSSGNEVAAAVKTIAEIVADHDSSNGLQGWLVKIEEAVVKEVDGQNITIAQGNNTILVSGVPSEITFHVNDIVTITGNIGSFNDVRIVNPSDVYLKPTITIDPLTYDLNSLNQGGTIEVGYTNIDFTNSPEVVFCDAEGSPATYEWITAQISSSNHNVSYTVEANNGVLRIAYLKVRGYDTDGEEVYSELVAIRQSAATVAVSGYYKKVTSTDDISNGQYLIVYETDNVAFNGGLETLDAVSNTIAVAIESESGKIIATEATNNAAFAIDVTAGTLKSASGEYIGVSSNSNGLKQSEDADTYTHTFSIDKDGNAVIAAVFDGSAMTLRFNKASNQNRFRYYKSGQEAIQLYKYVEFVAPANEYTTFCSTKALDFSNVDGLEAYIVTKVNEASVSTEKVTAAVPAETGLVLKKTGTANSYEVPVVAEAAAVQGNLLIGTVEPTEIGGTVGYTDLILYNSEFHPSNAGTIAAGKAYLHVEGEVASPALSIIGGDETTGISSIDNGQLIMDNVYYDLSGRRVVQPTKGMYIVNGRKVVIK